MDIKCPHCGTEYEIDKSEHGRFVKCEICGKGFVAGTSAAKKLGEAAKAFADAAKIATGSAHEWAKRQDWNGKGQRAKTLVSIICAKTKSALRFSKYRIVCAVGIGVILLACIFAFIRSPETNVASVSNDASIINDVDTKTIVLANFSVEKQFIEQAAAKGDINAQYVLRGFRYARGVGKNNIEAVKWFRKAAQQGDANAQYFLGIIYSGIGSGWDSEIDILLQDLHGYGVELNAKESASWYLKAAERGHAKAQFALGWSYFLGEPEIFGVPKDYGKAVTWYRKAAEQGNFDAQGSLAGCYRNGYGVKVDKGKAEFWDRKHAETAYMLGKCFATGDVVRKDDVKAAEWFRIASNNGHARAQYELHNCYLSGRGVKEDDKEAVNWLRKAAEQGLPEALYDLGWCYAHGLGVKKDRNEGAKWIRKAAEQNYVKAQRYLGFCYRIGLGVEKNGDEAIKWYRMAASQGYAMAERELGEMYADGKMVETNKREAVRWLRKADAHGDVAAHNILQREDLRNVE